MALQAVNKKNSSFYSDVLLRIVKKLLLHTVPFYLGYIVILSMYAMAFIEEISLGEILLVSIYPNPAFLGFLSVSTFTLFLEIIGSPYYGKDFSAMNGYTRSQMFWWEMSPYVLIFALQFLFVCCVNPFAFSSMNIPADSAKALLVMFFLKQALGFFCYYLHYLFFKYKFIATCVFLALLPFIITGSTDISSFSPEFFSWDSLLLGALCLAVIAFSLLGIYKRQNKSCRSKE